LGCGSSGRAPAWQTQGPEFNPSTEKKKKEKVKQKEDIHQNVTCVLMASNFAESDHSFQTLKD
jgi:hypothetical protein